MPITANATIRTCSTSTLTFSGMPALGDGGTLDIRLSATDLAGARVPDDFTIEIEPSNHGPVANSDTVKVNEDATTLNLWNTLLADDTEPDAGDTRTIVSVNTEGTVGTVSFSAATRTVTYSTDDPARDLLEPDGAPVPTNFIYMIRDAGDLESTATVTVNVPGV